MDEQKVIPSINLNMTMSLATITKVAMLSGFVRSATTERVFALLGMIVWRLLPKYNMNIEALKKSIREIGYELMMAESLGTYCEDFIEKRKLHDALLEKLYRLEKRGF